MSTLLIGIIHHSSFMAETAIDSLLDQLPSGSAICLLNNPKDQEYVKNLEKKYSSSEIKFLYQNSPKGFAENMNFIFKKFGSEFDYFMPFNDDAVAGPNLINNLLEVLDNNDLDVACPKILNPDGTLQPVYGPLPNTFTHISRHLNLKVLLKSTWITSLLISLLRILKIKSLNQYIKASKEEPKSSFVDRLSGACFMIRSSVFESCDGFDSKNFFMYSDDSDLSIRLKKLNKKIYLLDSTFIYHELSASMNTKAFIEKEKSMLRYLKKHNSNFFSLSFLRVLVTFIFIIKILGLFIMIRPSRSEDIILEIRRNFEIIKAMIKPIKLKE